MSMSDPVGDMLTRIRNAQRARHSVCVALASKLRENVLGVLKREGFIRGYASEQLRPGVAQLRIELKYNEGEPVIKEINRVSKPGRRVYAKIKELPRVLRGKRVCHASESIRSKFLPACRLMSPGVWSPPKAGSANRRRRCPTLSRSRSKPTRLWLSR